MDSRIAFGPARTKIRGERLLWRAKSLCILSLLFFDEVRYEAISRVDAWDCPVCAGAGVWRPARSRPRAGAGSGQGRASSNPSAGAGAGQGADRDGPELFGLSDLLVPAGLSAGQFGLSVVFVCAGSSCSGELRRGQSVLSVPPRAGRGI